LELILKDSEDSASDIEIKVKDTGIGIHTDKQERIFDRFFQNDVPGSMVNQGSGIGLAITKEFVNLHNGKISVESRPDKGTCFTITLPLKKINGAEFKDRGIIEEWKPQGSGNMEPVINRRKPTVLLVEDNEDFRFYLKDNLKQYYNILEAANGRLGWNKTLSMHPELIVSDVSMPEMNGIEFCLKIREDKRTSEIPVILLTALSDEEHLLQGIKTGANDYITKPFNFEILLSKIKNLLAHQASVRKTFQKRIEAAPADIEIESVDEKFIRKALQAVEDNISNPDFSVEDFSRLMCMSRVALYKKLMLLTRKTPIEFIRHIRLKRAASLLEKSQLTIAEIAYEDRKS